MQSPLAACFETICCTGAGGPSLLACQVSDYTHRHQARECSCLRGKIINYSNAEYSGACFETTCGADAGPLRTEKQSHLVACFETICCSGVGGPSLLACQVSDYTHGHQAREQSCLRRQIINYSNAESSGVMF
jgi:hypothetical protein